MNIAIFGFSGFIGSHIVKIFSKSHNILEISARNINYQLPEKDIFNYLENKLNRTDIIINCCANTNPKNKNDIFINENLSKIIQNFVIKKKLDIHFYHISSINVLIKDRMDKYTLTKINAEKNLINNFTSIIRLPLIINFKSGKKGDLKIFYKYLNIKLLPLFPMIYPGNIYRPIEIEKFCSFFLELINNKKKPQIYNLMGEEKKTLWDLFQFIAKSYRKKTLKINTLILNKILPNSIKNSFFKRNSFLGQFLSVDQSTIIEKEITFL